MRSDRDSVMRELRACITGYLFGVSKDLDMIAADRISIYCHDKQSSNFIQVFRIAPNPVLERKGRIAYRDDQGYIALAWQQGGIFINNLPDFETDKRGYIRETSKSNFPKGLHDELRMKSRLYFGWRISNLMGDKQLAVLILESTNPVRWEKGTLDEYFDTQSEKFRSIFERVYKTLPELSDAAKRGL